jgi:hypothetical protein
MEVPLRNFNGKTEENHENLNDSRCLGRHPNRAPPDYKFKSFPLDQPRRFQGKEYISVTCMWYVTIDGVWTGEWIYWPLIHTTWNYKQLQRHRYLHNSQITTAPAKPFLACCVFTRRSLATATNSGDSSASRAQVVPSPTPVQNCLPAISSGAEQSRAEAYCRQSAGTVTPGIRPRWDPWPYICWMLRPLRCFFFFLVGRHLWREDGSVIYICCWPLPAQSFFGPSPLGLLWNSTDSAYNISARTTYKTPFPLL